MGKYEYRVPAKYIRRSTLRTAESAAAVELGGTVSNGRMQFVVRCFGPWYIVSLISVASWQRKRSEE